jgi:dCTP deaminase
LILSDKDIKAEIKKGNIFFEPAIKEEDISPNSVDVHLGSEISVGKPIHDAVESVIDPSNPSIATVFPKIYDNQTIPDDGYVLKPHQFVLSRVKERLTLRSNISARIEGRSTLARLGITVHSTAPTVHATYTGWLTLEICNFGLNSIRLKQELPIAQLIFERVESIPERTLVSPWQGK